MVSAGTLIWISWRPLLRLVFCTGCGFGIAKADIFPAVAVAGASQMVLNITLPCQMFSKIVPSFSTQNISALGALVLMALIYQALGLVLGYIVKQLFWVPHRFRYGILVAAGWANVGDIPTSVLMSITGAAPFQGAADQTRSVAYISAFILVSMVTLFPFGGHKWVAWDFVGQDVEPEEVQEAMRLKRKAFLHPFTHIRQRSTTSNTGPRALESGAEKMDVGEAKSEPSVDSSASKDVIHQPLVEFETFPSVISSAGGGSIYKLGQGADVSILPVHKTNPEAVPASRLPSSSSLPTQSTHTPRSRKLRTTVTRRRISEFFRALITPSSMTILVSFVIALIPQLKALFVEVPGTYMPAAPDGQPPLAFLLDATSFVGAASVPLGLICLGSSIARLPIPRKGQWQKLPLGAIGCITAGKMIVMPVLGVFMCEGLTNAGVISREDKVLRLVCIFFSCLPTSTIQVSLTQVHSGTGSAEHLAPFLIPQYILMFISMTALTAYTLQIIF